ncbi:hypothetical protein [Marinilabilia rubra]|uniref:Uncharacterized protein n=1 Tax=Marinilabilia rubra TaxID=2162893 RepID=A0A2U2BBB3_9BACT|nr:hypothetical protein [Marinilabilia rubra]PWE00364.1 hypothetical protein DDZ16_05335 [Marinilabilia rubra]
MLFLIPPTIDIDNTATLVNQEVFSEQSMTSTCLNKTYFPMPEAFDLSIWKKENVFSTNLSLDNLEEQNNSTWEEDSLSEFDLVANARFSKTIKVNSRIKSVTKYKPNIIID